ncbi:DUF4105 domain-containing protein [Pseudogemmatithrix spongiicola]|uniref:DUF4105 domain-containing protein n=1 Tax=Pseudogemmatithrix spongiicola TaxID=3062599 RepID=A0AA49JTN2_9BACT|nr:DUF4105 domain-containing protein [Gemmatimonadaceae bacterium 'strain 138']WKW14615.1 DUF4105 domain-containing protein [Gemmatimonadaceae bacterium 'strain 318']
MPFAPMRVAVLAMMLAVLGSVPAAAQGPTAASALRVSVLTFGPGDLVFERFGHNALRIVDPATGSDLAYNWGMFSFDQPNFLGRFLSGDTQYWVEAFPSEPLIAFYAKFDRDAVEQVLDLTDAEKAELKAFVEANVREENKYYRYQYFLDNCSTRIRDALDRVMGGALQRRFVPITTTWSYRDESIRLTGPTYYSQLGIELALGPSADQPLTAWEAMFVPMRLRDYLREVTVPAPGGGTRPLVAQERVLHTPTARAPEPAERRGLTLGALGPVLGAWMLMLVPTSLEARRKRRIPAAVMAALFYGLTGLVGCVLLGMWLFSAHTFWYWNLTLLLCSPLALAAAILGARAVWRGERDVLATMVLAAVVIPAALALLLTPFVPQRLGGPLMLLLPGHLGLALVIWRHTQAPSAAAS